jgi:hypothetical protein
MKLFGYTDNLFYKCNEILFVLLFFFNRIIWNIYVWAAVQTAAVVRQEDFSKVNKIFQQTCITLHVLFQIIWLKEIIDRVFISKKNKNKEK